jgi:site-specific DNA-methyltransferase (adenine-specific)
MKQNSEIKVEDLTSNPTCGKPLVMGSTVFNEDCMTVMARYPDKFFDLAVVDPPYGIGMGASLNVNSKTKFIDKKWDTEIPTNEYFDELFRVSKNQIIWGGNYYPYLWQKGCKAFICWNKLNHHDNRADVEMAWTSFNKLAKYVEYMWDGNRYGTKGNIQGVGKPTIRIHPTEKPVYLYEWILKEFAEQGNLILDTHLGSGSHRIAATKSGFDFVGSEIDKDYFEAQEARFKDFVSQLRLFG